LGVRYIVDGSVRRSESRVRVTAQLVEAETSSHLWAERYDRDVREIFALQDEITTAIVNTILPVISDAELARILRKPPGSLDAWEAYQRGLWHMEKLNASDQAQAYELFARAIALDAVFAPAYSALAEVILREGTQFSTRPLREAADKAISWARKAAEINPDDSDAWAALAPVVIFTGNVREALEHASKALSLNPDSAWANSMKGALLIDLGHHAEGRDLLFTALRLRPRDSRNAVVFNHLARSYFYERDFERAVEAGFNTVSRYPNHPTAYCWLAAALGHSGRTPEAGEALQKARAISAGSWARFAQGGPPFFRAEDHELMLDGLRKAGWEN
jgi:adenylate cyclase